MHTDAGDIILKINNKGMLYLDLRELKAKAALSLVKTAQWNMEGFTKRKVEEAQKGCKAQGMLGHPTDCDFLGMVCGDIISNTVAPTTVKKIYLIFLPPLSNQ